MKEYQPSGFFVLRTPLLPFEDFLKLSEDSRAAHVLEDSAVSSDRESLAQAATLDRRKVSSKLQELATLSEVKEALWLASPDFASVLAQSWDKPETEKKHRLERTLYRYVARMTGRATPFGLFAGCSVGRIGGETQLAISARNLYQRRSRLDMEYLYNLAEKVVRDPALRSDLVVQPNSSLYFVAGAYRHGQRYHQDKESLYRLVVTEHTPYLAATLERAASGATPRALACALVEADPEVSLDEAEAYVGELIDSQVLVSDFAPSVTGPEPIGDMISQLRQSNNSALAEALGSIAERLRTIDRNEIGTNEALYQDVVDTIAQLPVTFAQDHLVQVDLMKPAPNACLDQRLVRDILRSVETLHSIQATTQNEVFEQFKKDFLERYQDQEVPLLEVLDDEVGIGFGSNTRTLAEPLLEDLDLSHADSPTEFKGKKSELVLLRKLEELQQGKQEVLTLDAELTEALRVKNPLPLPDAFSVLGMLSAPCGQRANPEASFYLEGVYGPSGANLLARFCAAGDQLHASVQDHLRAEEELQVHQGVVFAEIVHLPEGRPGNVLCRPILRPYEIPYLATSRVPADHQIPLSDLLVSVKNERIVLRSQRLRCEVLPRLTTAHNFTVDGNLAPYKFLCHLQLQGSSRAAWNWRNLEHLAFLPRVVSGNILFALARWLLTKPIIQELVRREGSERLRCVHQWRKSNNVPRFVFLVESDSQLLIDFENVLSVEALVEHVKNLHEARLVEMFPGPDALPVRGPEGTFVHEIIVPFVRQTTRAPAFVPHSGFAETAAMAGRIKPPVHLARRFLPGSEWLFAKIYMGPSHADQLLLGFVKQWAEELIAAGHVDRWFFIRYGDPHWHLRLRFHGDPQTLHARVMPQLCKSVENQVQLGRAWRVQFDTYEREIERYGGPGGMEVAERFFHYDSEACLNLLATIGDRLGSEERSLLSLVSADYLLTGLGFDLPQKKNLVAAMRQSWEKTLGVSEAYRRQMSDKFRKKRQVLADLLDKPGETTEILSQAQPVLRTYLARLKVIRRELNETQAAGGLTAGIPVLAADYVHMHLNRMLRSAQSAQEMVLHDFLARTYDSQLARASRPSS